jgi:hypothetical protein
LLVASRGAPLHFAREGQRRLVDLGEAPARRDPRVHVDTSRAARLGPAGEAVVAEHLVSHDRHAPDLVPAHAGHGIQVDAQLVGMLQVARPHGVRVEIDAP